VKGNWSHIGRGGKAVLYIGIAAGIGFGYFLCSGPGGRDAGNILNAGGTVMAGRTGSEAAQRTPEVPGVDLASHGATETATFAMG